MNYTPHIISVILSHDKETGKEDGKRIGLEGSKMRDWALSVCAIASQSSTLTPTPGCWPKSVCALMINKARTHFATSATLWGRAHVQKPLSSQSSGLHESNPHLRAILL
jgi:hypothetical protein